MFPNKLFYFNIRISCPRMCLLSGKIRLGFALDVNSERLWMCLYRWMPKNSLLKVYLIFFPSDQTMRLMLSRFFFQNNLGYSQKQDWEEFWNFIFLRPAAIFRCNDYKFKKRTYRYRLITIPIYFLRCFNVSWSCD